MFMVCVGARIAAPMVILLTLTSMAWAGGPAPSQQAVANDPQQLKKLSLEQLGNVEVTTEFKQPTQVWNTPSAIYVLTGEEIRRSGVTNLPDALRLVPGVNVERLNGSRNWAVGIRGFGDQFSKYVLVLVDGRSVYTPLFGGTYWEIDNVLIEDVDRIEVIRGPGGTIWGADAVNGVINIITKSSAETQGGLVTGGGGSVDRGTAGERYGQKVGKWTVREDAFGFDREPEYHVDGQPAYDWSRLGQIGFRADRTGPNSETTVQGDAYLGKLGDAQQLSTYTPPATYLSYAPTDVSGGDVLYRWRRNLDGGGNLYLQGFWSHDHRIGSNFGEDRDNLDLDFLHRLPRTRWQQFTYGVGIHVSPSKATQTVPTDQFIPSFKTNQVYSAFLQEDLRLIPSRLQLSLGSKLEHNNYTGFEYQPNGRLLWTPTQTQSLWAAISRAVRTPDRVDEDIQVDAYAEDLPPLVYARIAGNPAIQSERLVAYEGGYRALLQPRFYLSISGFHNIYRDLIAQGPAQISLAPAPPFPAGSLLVTFQYINGIHGHTDGVEIAPDWQPVSWWRMRASYSYLHMQLEDNAGFTDTTTLTTLHGSSPNSEASLHSSLDLPGRLEFDQMVRFVGALPAQQVKGYVTSDVRLGWNATRALNLSVTGQNLLQPHHAEFNIDPGPMVLIKRGVYAKIVWSY